MTPFNQRLELIINHLGLTPAQFGELHNVGRVSIHKMLQGETKPGLETIERICMANPKISAEYLIRGEGQPLIADSKDNTIDSNKTLSMLFEIQSKLNDVLIDAVRDVKGEKRHHNIDFG